MVSMPMWVRYMANKLEYSVSLTWKKYNTGQITEREVGDTVWKNIFHGKLTYLHWNKGEEMAPTIGGQGGTLLVRKLPSADPDEVFVGDVVVLKDPENSDNYLVRRLAAIEGYEMESTDEKDEPFVLEDDQCWVLSDNETLKAKKMPIGSESKLYLLDQILKADIPLTVIQYFRDFDELPIEHSFVQEANDSRKFGPVPMTDIVGRVIYSLQTAVDHGPVQNSRYSMKMDSSVLEVELDVNEMTKSSK